MRWRREGAMRGFYGSATGEAREKIACGWDKKKKKKEGIERCSYGKEGDRWTQKWTEEVEQIKRKWMRNLRVKLPVGSNDMEQKAEIGKVMGRVQDNRRDRGNWEWGFWIYVQSMSPFYHTSSIMVVHWRGKYTVCQCQLIEKLSPEWCEALFLVISSKSRQRHPYSFHGLKELPINTSLCGLCISWKLSISSRSPTASVPKPVSHSWSGNEDFTPESGNKHLIICLGNPKLNFRFKAFKLQWNAPKMFTVWPAQNCWNSPLHCVASKVEQQHFWISASKSLNIALGGELKNNVVAQVKGLKRKDGVWGMLGLQG